ncbi:875_t:CDS:2, partial [Paraglomus brasilianum]
DEHEIKKHLISDLYAPLPELRGGSFGRTIHLDSMWFKQSVTVSHKLKGDAIISEQSVKLESLIRERVPVDTALALVMIPYGYKIFLLEKFKKYKNVPSNSNEPE